MTGLVTLTQAGVLMPGWSSIHHAGKLGSGVWAEWTVQGRMFQVESAWTTVQRTNAHTEESDLPETYTGAYPVSLGAGKGQLPMDWLGPPRPPCFYCRSSRKVKRNSPSSICPDSHLEAGQWQSHCSCFLVNPSSNYHGVEYTQKFAKILDWPRHGTLYQRNQLKISWKAHERKYGGEGTEMGIYFCLLLKTTKK